jgi:hypothetical protein
MLLVINRGRCCEFHGQSTYEIESLMNPKDACLHVRSDMPVCMSDPVGTEMAVENDKYGHRLG